LKIINDGGTELRISPFIKINEVCHYQRDGHKK